MRRARLFLCSLFGWPLGMAVESVLLACWPLYLYLWLGLGWRWYAALPALLIGWIGANLIGLATLRPTFVLPEIPLGVTTLVSLLDSGPPVYHFAPWLWIYDNDEDGVGGPLVGRNGNERRWVERVKNYPLWLRILSWQFRNPIANLRLSRWGVHLDGARIESVGNCRRPDRDFAEGEQAVADGIGFALRGAEAKDAQRVTRNYLRVRDGRWFWLWARKGWRVGLWIVRPSRRWRTITHAIGWRVFAFDPALDKAADAHQGFKVQPWRRG